MAKQGFQIVGEVEAPQPSDPLAEQKLQQARQAQAQAAQQAQQATTIMMLALRTFGQRALIAVANLFSLVTVISVWWLWAAEREPDTHQLIGLGGYAVFVLLINYIVKRA